MAFDSWYFEKFEKEKEKKNPFKIICMKCGSHRVMVTAYEHLDLGIQCKDCGFMINCGSYDTDENYCPDMEW